MDTKAKDVPVALSAVVDYATAIQRCVRVAVQGCSMDYLVCYYAPIRTRNVDYYDACQRSRTHWLSWGLEESDAGTGDDIKRCKQEYKRQYEGRGVTPGTLAVISSSDSIPITNRRKRSFVGHMPTHLTKRLTHNGQSDYPGLRPTRSWKQRWTN